MKNKWSWSSKFDQQYARYFLASRRSTSLPISDHEMVHGFSDRLISLFRERSPSHFVESKDRSGVIIGGFDVGGLSGSFLEIESVNDSY